MDVEVQKGRSQRRPPCPPAPDAAICSRTHHGSGKIPNYPGITDDRASKTSLQEPAFHTRGAIQCLHDEQRFYGRQLLQCPPREISGALQIAQIYACANDGGVGACHHTHWCEHASRHHAVGARRFLADGGTAPSATQPASFESALQSAAAVPTQVSPEPADVVEAYFRAVNDGEYIAAWALGGKNILGGTYDYFVRSFVDTARDEVTINSVLGDQVEVELDATQTDGSHRFFAGNYTVQNGVIVKADIHQV